MSTSKIPVKTHLSPETVLALEKFADSRLWPRAVAVRYLLEQCLSGRPDNPACPGQGWRADSGQPDTLSSGRIAGDTADMFRGRTSGRPVSLDEVVR